MRGKVSYLLDTNPVVVLLNGRPEQALKRISDRLLSLGPGEAAISVISVFELCYGAEKSDRPTLNRERLDGILKDFDTVNFSEADASAAGRVRADLTKLGTPIGRYDTLIAGQALARDLILITNNTREFARVPGLRVEDWSDP